MNVVFLIFNRPQHTQRVFEEIARARPEKLLVVGDGPRGDREGEAECVAQTRKVIDAVDWPCEVLTEYSDTNLGCRKRVSSGLTWAFEQVEEAVILEDDCLPHPSFFRYCTALLDRYRRNDRIAYVSGDNFFPPRFRFRRRSYHYSIYGGIWGWATWRRAWRLYDDAMQDWPALRDNGWHFAEFVPRRAADAMERDFNAMYAGEIDTWDFCWFFSVRREQKLVCVPELNLVSNIGFGGDSTHTDDTHHVLACRKTGEIDAVLRSPPRMVADTGADLLYARGIILGESNRLTHTHRTLGRYRAYASKALRRRLTGLRRPRSSSQH